MSPRLFGSFKWHAVDCLACDESSTCSAALAEACGSESCWTSRKTLSLPGGRRAASECQPRSQGAIKLIPRRVLLSMEQTIKTLSVDW